MTATVYTFTNSKPGTGKSTSAVWLAHSFHEAGEDVVLVDADPGGSTLRWSDVVSFRFRTFALPSKEIHVKLPALAVGATRVIIDAPQVEDHPGITRSAIRAADHVIIPVAPTPIEIERMGGMKTALEEVSSLLPAEQRVDVLLNRCVNNAASTPESRQFLTEADWAVLSTTIPRKEIYAQSWGAEVTARGTAYDELRTELMKG